MSEKPEATACQPEKGATKTNRAYRYRIYPDKRQQRLINDTFGCVRFIYNKMLEEKQAAFARQTDDPSATPVKTRLPADYKKDHPWLRQVDSLALANAQLHLESAMRNFFKHGAGFPRFKSKRRDKQTYTTNNQRGSVRLIDDKTLQLPKLKKVKIKLHRPLPAGALIKGASISKSPKGDYYAAILLEMPDAVRLVRQPDTGGQTELIIDGDYQLTYPAAVAKTKAKIEKLKQAVRRRKRGGKNRTKALKKLARLYEKTANQKKDHLHKLSRRITNAWDNVASVDRTNRDGLYALKRLLDYKLAGAGKRHLRVGREPCKTQKALSG